MNCSNHGGEGYSSDCLICKMEEQNELLERQAERNSEIAAEQIEIARQKAESDREAREEARELAENAQREARELAQEANRSAKEIEEKKFDREKRNTPENCPKCKRPVKGILNICLDCGNKLQKKCPYCNQENFVSWKHCIKCELDEKSAREKKEKELEELRLKEERRKLEEERKRILREVEEEIEKEKKKRLEKLRKEEAEKNKKREDETKRIRDALASAMSSVVTPEEEQILRSQDGTRSSALFGFMSPSLMFSIFGLGLVGFVTGSVIYSFMVGLGTWAILRNRMKYGTTFGQMSNLTSTGERKKTVLEAMFLRTGLPKETYPDSSLDSWLQGWSGTTAEPITLEFQDWKFIIFWFAALGIALVSWKIFEVGPRQVKNNIIIKVAKLLGNKSFVSRQDMVLIPAGEFWMGSGEESANPGMGGSQKEKVSEKMNGEDWVGIFWGKPRHRVYVDAFYIDKYMVTFDQYDSFCEATGRDKPHDGLSYGTGKDKIQKPGWGRGQRPVINVSWYDAQAYAAWVGKRLPTEAEWERAARGGTHTNYFFGDDPNLLGDYGWYAGNSDGGSHPVGEKKPNPYGLYDMTGNAWEWCSDWFDEHYYGSSPERNPTGPERGKQRVQRGGSWRDFSIYSRSAYRYGDTPDRYYYDIGFRCAGTPLTTPLSGQDTLQKLSGNITGSWNNTVNLNGKTQVYVVILNQNGAGVTGRMAEQSDGGTAFTGSPDKYKIYDGNILSAGSIKFSKFLNTSDLLPTLFQGQLGRDGKTIQGSCTHRTLSGVISGNFVMKKVSDKPMEIGD